MTKNKIKPQAVYGLIFSSSKDAVLLVQRRDLPVWVLPGGGLDVGETPEQGVIREVEEETTLQVKIERKVADYLPVNALTEHTHLFECSIIDGIPTATAESKQVAFFQIESLPRRLAPPFALWIKDALANHSPLQKPTEGVTYFTLVYTLICHPLLVIRYLLTKIGIRFNDKLD